MEFLLLLVWKIVAFYLILPTVVRSEEAPVFLEPVNNATVVIGRDVTLTCVVDHVGPYQVAWIHLDRQMIVAIHEHLVTRIPRFSASHDRHRTWSLHLRKAQSEDAGRYMCQVNSNPMITQVGIVDVVVSPMILDFESSPSHITVREGARVTLSCRGDGVPLPRVTWRREDGRPINIAPDRKKEVASVEGEKLVLNKITRTESGAYLCIASNGVPPSVSKRILLDVEFPPMVWVPIQMVGSALGGWVSFECHTEAQPKAISYWARDNGPDSELVLMPNQRIQPEITSTGYRTHMKLTIQQLQAQDIGNYRCVAKNSLGEAEGSVRLIGKSNTKKTSNVKEQVIADNSHRLVTTTSSQGWLHVKFQGNNSAKPPLNHQLPDNSCTGLHSLSYLSLPCVVILINVVLL